jgi:hypothetical protein
MARESIHVKNGCASLPVAGADLFKCHGHLTLQNAS